MAKRHEVKELKKLVWMDNDGEHNVEDKGNQPVLIPRGAVAIAKDHGAFRIIFFWKEGGHQVRDAKGHIVRQLDAWSRYAIKKYAPKKRGSK